MPTSAPEPLLRVEALSAGYGKIGVLRGVDLTVGASEVVALLGPNGAGKTTLLRAVSGLLPWSGDLSFGGRDLAGAGPRECTKAGLVHVIEGHRVFTQLSVLDNLLLAAYDLPRGERAARVEEALGYFPEIAAKRHERAVALSGGQQQMLAVAQTGTGVLLVEHHADLIFDICHHVTVLNLGKKLAEGTPADIRSHREVVNAYLGG